MYLQTDPRPVPHLLPTGPGRVLRAAAVRSLRDVRAHHPDPVHERAPAQDYRRAGAQREAERVKDSGQ